MKTTKKEIKSIRDTQSRNCILGSERIKIAECIYKIEEKYEQEMFPLSEKEKIDFIYEKLNN